MKVAIIQYNAGNIRSVIFALERLGIHPVLTDDTDTIRQADRVIFPGVGEASTTMRYLRQRGLDQLIPQLTQPVLGICLGMQLMCAHSEENDTPCLGIFPNEVKKFPQERGIKVPHMGWNDLLSPQGQLFESLPGQPYVYFVHSYYVDSGAYTQAACHYIKDFSAALHKDNFYATQFHPEKSGAIGAQILENFIHLN